MDIREIVNLSRDCPADIQITLFDETEHKPTYDICADIEHDPFFNTTVIIIRRRHLISGPKMDYEMVEEGGAYNTWPLKVKRLKDQKIMGKFKDRYLAGMFLEFLQTRWDPTLAREMALLKREQRRSSLI